MALNANQRLVAKQWLTDAVSRGRLDDVLDLLEADNATRIATLRAYAAARRSELAARKQDAANVAIEVSALADAMDAVAT